jgi:hypothetical protein
LSVSVSITNTSFSLQHKKNNQANYASLTYKVPLLKTHGILNLDTHTLSLRARLRPQKLVSMQASHHELVVELPGASVTLNRSIVQSDPSLAQLEQELQALHSTQTRGQPPSFATMSPKPGQAQVAMSVSHLNVRIDSLSLDIDMSAVNHLLSLKAIYADVIEQISSTVSQIATPIATRTTSLAGIRIPSASRMSQASSSVGSPRRSSLGLLASPVVNAIRDAPASHARLLAGITFEPFEVLVEAANGAFLFRGIAGLGSLGHQDGHTIAQATLSPILTFTESLMRGRTWQLVEDERKQLLSGATQVAKFETRLEARLSHHRDMNDEIRDVRRLMSAGMPMQAELLACRSAAFLSIQEPKLYLPPHLITVLINLSIEAQRSATQWQTEETRALLRKLQERPRAAVSSITQDDSLVLALKVTQIQLRFPLRMDAAALNNPSIKESFLVCIFYICCSATRVTFVTGL